VTTLAATFGNPSDAALARASLVRAGVPVERVALSVNFTLDDAIAAEYPGQSFENQAYRGSDQVKAGPGYTDTERARFNEEVRSAACVLTVQLEAEKGEAIAGMLRELGAKSVMEAIP
jgi:hypothetical protein